MKLHDTLNQRYWCLIDVTDKFHLEASRKCLRWRGDLASQFWLCIAFEAKVMMSFIYMSCINASLISCLRTCNNYIWCVEDFEEFILYLDGKNGGALREEESHVAGDIEGSRQPSARRHNDLCASIGRPRIHRCHGFLEAFGVHGAAIANGAKIGEVEHVRPEAGHRSRRRKFVLLPRVARLPVEEDRERAQPRRAKCVPVGDVRPERRLHELRNLQHRF